ncbi:S-formylglutathione hydrolase [Congregibacter litoralis]|uniref:S-formylglutathione hydrolase n=1 Tax=Congregibacter litoralis KT71 TaxID=314285 RepID=A4AE00_9GAMM|nr:S-formylglutathione hydrolase [Congregibacter litoralis]EAQ95748.1 S-formylglutathione hydrolase [Congregibacter litoralis KT71]
MERVSAVRSFGGQQLRFKHASAVLRCDMHFSLYLPPQAATGSVPLLTWLSGLTCTDENFVQKACAQRAAAEQGVAILAPDTSPRGEGVADDPEGSWDLGLGAGFYVNATEAPWSEHYHMYDYVLEELPALVAEQHSVDLERQSIFGHSMGGHGALSIALRNPERFRSVSAFAPICAPLQCPWGEKAFSAYLGMDRELWASHDSCELIRRATSHLPMLVDQGAEDSFFEEQLKTPLLAAACQESAYPANIRMQEGYDHSYFFIASFMDEHVAFHAGHCAP